MIWRVTHDAWLMDNLAHTLLGLSLAKTGLERVTPRATAALIISSNLPDIDVVARLSGDTMSHLRYHRGFTHSLVGLVVLAALLTLLLIYIDRRRTSAGPRARPLSLFWVSCVGGMGHAFFDYSNSYGIRPFLPFSGRWYYGDFAFVVDPWIWLMLGSALVWLTARSKRTRVTWLVLGLLTSALVALVHGTPSQPGVEIPAEVRLCWFAGIGLILLGLKLNWGRAGPILARCTLALLVAYYGGVLAARHAAASRVRASAPLVTPKAVWPTPANPLVWQVVAEGQGPLRTGYVSVARSGAVTAWSQLDALDPKLVEAMRRSDRVRSFLEFARYTAATVEEAADGYSVVVRDLRFTLQMKVELDRDVSVRSCDVRWY